MDGAALLARLLADARSRGFLDPRNLSGLSEHRNREAFKRCGQEIKRILDDAFRQADLRRPGVVIKTNPRWEMVMTFRSQAYIEALDVCLPPRVVPHAVPHVPIVELYGASRRATFDYMNHISPILEELIGSRSGTWKCIEALVQAISGKIPEHAH